MRSPLAVFGMTFAVAVGVLVVGAVVRTLDSGRSTDALTRPIAYVDGRAVDLRCDGTLCRLVNGSGQVVAWWRENEGMLECTGEGPTVTWPTTPREERLP